MVYQSREGQKAAELAPGIQRWLATLDGAVLLPGRLERGTIRAGAATATIGQPPGKTAPRTARGSEHGLVRIEKQLGRVTASGIYRKTAGHRKNRTDDKGSSCTDESWLANDAGATDWRLEPGSPAHQQAGRDDLEVLRALAMEAVKTNADEPLDPVQFGILLTLMEELQGAGLS